MARLSSAIIKLYCVVVNSVIDANVPPYKNDNDQTRHRKRHGDLGRVAELRLRGYNGFDGTIHNTADGLTAESKPKAMRIQ